MSETVRFNFYLPIEVVNVADRIGGRRGLTRKGVILRALGVLQALEDGTEAGYTAGLTKNRECLATVLVTP